MSRPIDVKFRVVRERKPFDPAQVELVIGLVSGALLFGLAFLGTYLHGAYM